jgi:hypothetical protein
MVYEVELTNVAEDSYDRFQAKAQTYICRGLHNHSAVRNFYAIQKALDETLPFDPMNPELALVGHLSFLYILPLGRISITYTINEGKPAVIVQTIARTIHNEGMRQWLNTGIESGELGPLLQSLGIQPSLLKMQVNSRYAH